MLQQSFCLVCKNALNEQYKAQVVFFFLSPRLVDYYESFETLSNVNGFATFMNM